MKVLSVVVGFLLLSLPAWSQEQWNNRIGNQSCHPIQYGEPKTLEELCHHIKQAVSQGYPVRAIGNGYSLSDIGCTTGYLLSLKHLNHILSIDLENKRVRVEAGILLQEFNQQLAVHGLALSNQAAIAQITVGGALSTGVHGTGHTSTLSSFIREIELITAEGTLYLLSEASDPEAFAAANVSLGSLGVIYAVTLQCEPLFYVNASSEMMDIENVIENYKTLHDANDFFQFSWNVTTGKALINRWNRCPETFQADKVVAECVASYQALPFYTIDENDRICFRK